MIQYIRKKIFLITYSKNASLIVNYLIFFGEIKFYIICRFKNKQIGEILKRGKVWAYANYVHKYRVIKNNKTFFKN
jgi:hypothetical protein